MILYILLLVSFSHQHSLMVFPMSLIDRKSPLVSRTLLSILADLNNAIVWMISHLNSINLRPLNKVWGTVRSVPFTSGITATFMLYSFFSSLAKSKYLSLFLFLSDFHIVIRQDGKVLYTPVSLSFSLSITRFAVLFGISWSVCISKSQRILCIVFIII